MIVLRTKSGESYSNVGLSYVIRVSFRNAMNNKTDMAIDDIKCNSDFYTYRWWKADDTQYTIVSSNETIFLTGDSLESIKTTIK